MRARVVTKKQHWPVKQMAADSHAYAHSLETQFQSPSGVSFILIFNEVLSREEIDVAFFFR